MDFTTVFVEKQAPMRSRLTQTARSFSLQIVRNEHFNWRCHQCFLNFRTPNNIVGFIFNRLSPQLVDEIKALCNEAGTEFLGYFPNSPECALESRKLGLVTPEGVCELKQKTQLLAGKAEQYIKISSMLELAESHQLTTLQKCLQNAFWRQDCGCTRRCFLIYIPRQYTISGASRCRNYIFFPN